jgi:hypothetical protein
VIDTTVARPFPDRYATRRVGEFRDSKLRELEVNRLSILPAIPVLHLVCKKFHKVKRDSRKPKNDSRPSLVCNTVN